MKEDNTFGLSKDVQIKICEVFAQNPNVIEVIIYGSRAKGNYKSGSDIDLTLVGDNLTTTDLLKIENDLDDLLLPYKLDLSILRQIENQDLLDHINRIGKIFYAQPRG